VVECLECVVIILYYPVLSFCQLNVHVVLTPLKNLVDFGISTVSVHAGEYIDEVTKAVVTSNSL